MKQQINLYPSEIEGDKIILSLDNLLVGSMILIVVLAGMYLFEYRKVWVLEDDVITLISQVAERKKTIDKLNVSIKSKESLKKTGGDSLELLRNELELKRQSISELQNIQKSGSTGFSRYFESLSKNIPDGVWLKEFSIYDGGDGFDFKGNATDGQLVMEFLERLSKDEFFKNKNFSTLEVARGEGKSPQIRFIVNTGGNY